MTLRALRILLQLAVAIGLVATLWHMSGGDLFARLAGAHPGWAAAGLAFATASMAAGAARWRYTAGSVGTEIGAAEAVREFYLAVFLNLTLPGGLAGDALKAWRHGRRGVRPDGGLDVGSVVSNDQANPQSDGVPTESAGSPVEIDRLSTVGGDPPNCPPSIERALRRAEARSPDPGARRRRRRRAPGLEPAVHAVLIERLANQMVVSLCVLASMSLWLWMPGGFAHARIWVPLLGAAIVVGASLAAIAVLARRGGGSRIERFLYDSRQALLSRRALAVQLGLGLAVIGSCIAMFGCAARAVGAPLSPFHLLALVPGALFAMSIPISIGGWGLREASAVGLWTVAGLPASDAMATSVLYGVLVLVGALPGSVVLALDRRHLT